MREQIRRKRSALSSQFCNDAAEKIAQTVFSLPEFQSAKTIGVYFSDQNEVDTQMIIEEAWCLNKKVYSPVLKKDKTLNFFLYHPDIPLKKNKFKIYEPNEKNAEPIDIASLDIVLVPLVGFSKECNRLGRGLGCYDRTFEFLKDDLTYKPQLIGLAYEIQKIEITPEEWDVKLDFVVTEEKLYSSPTGPVEI